MASLLKSNNTLSLGRSGYAKSSFLITPSGLALLNNETHDDSSKNVPIMHSLIDSVPAFCSLRAFQ